jgi:hypothetical protein
MNEEITTQIEVRPNTLAIVTYRYIGPKPAPASGDDWEEQIDYPSVLVMMALPASIDSFLVEYLQSTRKALEETLGPCWGQPHQTHRICKKRYSAPTVRGAYELARAAVADALVAVGMTIDARNRRLEQRARTIAASRVDSPFHHVD